MMLELKKYLQVKKENVLIVSYISVVYVEDVINQLLSSWLIYVMSDYLKNDVIMIDMIDYNLLI